MQWYEQDVKNTIDLRSACPYDPKTIFYGSSSIRLWNSLYEDFKDYHPVNLGFGGSTLAACIWFFDRIVTPVPAPDRFILYAGDNDLGDGRRPEEVLAFFKEFMVKLRSRFPEVLFYYISIKPSPSRISLTGEILYTNKLVKDWITASGGRDHFVDVVCRMTDADGKIIKSLFDCDELHLNNDGYAIWKEVILKECFSPK